MIALLTDIVLTTAGFLLILLAVVILRQHGGKRSNKNLLVAFLLSKSFLMVRWFSFRFWILSFENFRSVYYVSCSAFFLLAPWLYFYIKSLCYRDFSLRRKDAVHFIPFAGIVILAIIRSQIQSSPSAVELTVLQNTFVSHFWKMFWTANFVQIFFYIVAMLRTVYIYQTKLKNLYSSLERINLHWVVSLLVLISLHWVFVVSRSTLSLLNAHVGIVTSIMDLFSITIFLVFTTILVIKGLHQLKIFSGIEGKQKYANSGLPQTDIQKYIEKLKNFMETQKPYLIPQLTIDDLSEKLSIPSWHLSRVINTSFNQNFFNFINNYRVEEAKRLMMEPTNNDMTILEILYEVGFNSKSTFNEVFKKQTGMTPSEFKKSNQN
ncbi:MAG: helix-turn-helix transcriptional regulator [Gemmatimonadota bacterium]|nr:MAG: helix-turn-helix transcriptional regulator [Gemmatimonadota bacterium]